MTNKLSRTGLAIGVIGVGSLVDIGFQGWNEIATIAGFIIYVYGDDIKEVFS